MRLPVDDNTRAWRSQLSAESDDVLHHGGRRRDANPRGALRARCSEGYGGETHPETCVVAEPAPHRLASLDDLYSLATAAEITVPPEIKAAC
jgi:hypothetical protein